MNWYSIADLNRTFSDYQLFGDDTSTKQTANSQRSNDMEGLIAAFLITGSLFVVAVVAQVYGVDSRSSYADDWSR